MVGTLLALTAFAIFASAAVGSYLVARNFVQRRLRFVDAVRKPSAPLLAGGAAFLIALPFTLLPLVWIPTAVVFGLGTAFGTAAGVRALNRADNLRGRLYHR
jgi:uncharacterized membrane protein